MRYWIFVFSFWVAYSYGQDREELRFDHQFVYKVTYQTDSNDESSVKSIDMELLTNKDISLFQSIDKGRRDSGYLAERKVATPMLIVRPINKFNFQIIKSGDRIKTYDSAFGMNLQGIDQIYYYEEPRDMLDWRISDDTLSIGNMLCQRADVRFGGRDWIAWFTPEIPVADGPYKFCGLPGLIVSIADTKNHWRFDLTNVRNVEKRVTLNFQSWYEFVPATKEQLYRERRAFQDNLVANLEAAGADFSHPASVEYTHERGKKEIGKRIAKDNNWIELIP